jgi:hypothetical protein
MDKRWQWSRLPGWFEVSKWRDTVGNDGTPPPPDSLLLAKPAGMAFLAAAPMPWSSGLKTRQLIKMTADTMRTAGMLLGPIEENDDDSCGFVWTSADGLNSGKTLVRVAPEEPLMILVISAIWSSDQDDLSAEFDIIAPSLHRDG